MKIIHCADLHLDSKMTANLSKEQAKQRRNEILNTFTRMIDYASVHEVEAVLIAGDLFDTRRISAAAAGVVMDAIAMHPDITFFYLKGNHDSESFLMRYETVPDNLKLFSDTWTTYRLGGIVVAGLELCPFNQALAYHSLVLDHDDYNIVMLHGQERAYATKDKAEVIAFSELKNKNIDYLALGHIHSFKHAPLDARGEWCYSGCLEGRGFDECGPKGFVLLDIEEASHHVNKQFIPFASRTLETVGVDVSDCMTTQEAAEQVKKVLDAGRYSSRSLIKLVLKGACRVESEFQTEYLTEKFSGGYYFFKTEDETTVRIDYRDYAKDESLKGEFIRMVLASELSGQEKSDVIRTGIAALSGEELS